jgi:hypothetical protein
MKAKTHGPQGFSARSSARGQAQYSRLACGRLTNSFRLGQSAAFRSVTQAIGDFLFANSEAFNLPLAAIPVNLKPGDAKKTREGNP